MMDAGWTVFFVEAFAAVIWVGVAALVFVMAFALHSWWVDRRKPTVTEPVDAPKTIHPSQYSGECIPLTTTEVLSQCDRVWWAEQMILQIPYQHPDRNAWLMNYGRSAISIALRAQNNVVFDENTKAARLS